MSVKKINITSATGFAILIIMLMSLVFVSITIVKHYLNTINVYNPNNVKVHVGISQLPTIYINILNYIAQNNYTEANELMNYLSASPLQNLEITSSISNEISALITQITLLNELYTTGIQELRQQNVNESMLMFSQTLIITAQLENTLSYIQRDMGNLIYFLTVTGYLNSGGDVLNPLTAKFLPSNPLNLNLTYILILNKTINKIYLKVNNTYSNALNNIKNIQSRIIILNKYNKTTISAWSDTRYVIPGLTVGVYGVLKNSEGVGIGNATLTIYYNNRGRYYPIANVTTNATGYFSTYITIPQFYGDRLILLISYVPQNDSGYAPSNQYLVFNVLYANTVITVSLNNNVIWGEPLNISGWVNGPSNRTIEILIDGKVISTTTSEDGTFNLSISTLFLKSGSYVMTIYAEPKGAYAPAYLNETISVIALPATLSVSTNKYVVAGVPFKIVGIIPMNKSLGGPWKLIITIGTVGEIITTTNSDFDTEITLPLLIQTGNYVINVTLLPNPPYSGYTTLINVFVINPIEVAAITFVIALIPAMIVVKLPRESNEPKREIAILPPDIKPIVELIYDVKNKIRSKVALLVYENYINTLNKLINKYNVTVDRSMTLREIVEELSPFLNEATYKTLLSINDFVEKILYGNYTPSSNEVDSVNRSMKIVGDSV